LKTAILGAGALGCSIGSALAEAGLPVWLINRRTEHVQEMRRLGLRVRVDGVDRVVAVSAATHARQVQDEAGTVDLLVVLVKSFHTEEAMRSALGLIGPDTVVLSLQNGLGHEDVLGRLVGRDRVVAGKTYAGGVLLGPGHVLRSLRGRETLIGELDGSMSARVIEIARTFDAAGVPTEAQGNIIGTIWDKLFVNVATGALSAITRLNYGGLYATPAVEACALAAVEEAMQVAQAQGVRVASASPQQVWRKAAEGLPAEFKASMLQSLEAGSVTEVDYVNGAVVEQGRRAGVPTPVNQTLVACVKGIERTLCGPAARLQ
jgi:2-dehydropantoate 2-reductase